MISPTRTSLSRKPAAAVAGMSNRWRPDPQDFRIVVPRDYSLQRYCEFPQFPLSHTATNPKRAGIPRALRSNDMQRLGKNIGKYFGEGIDIKRVIAELDTAADAHGWKSETF